MEHKPESVRPKQILREMFFLVSALIAIRFFMNNSIVMSIFIALNIGARFLLIGRRHDWIFLLIGIICGGGNDYISMVKDVYYYTPKDILPAPIPAWMLIFWGHIFVAFRQMFQLPAFQGAKFANGPWKIDKRLVADFVTVIILRIIIYRFVRQEPIPALGYAGVIALRLLIVPPGKFEWLLMASVVPMGLLYEAALIGCGLYVYYDKIFLGMPAWLMIYWTFMIPVFLKGIFDRTEVWLAENKVARIE